jgi:dipeptidyl aminopeptidase/acylaminoacyl peptidase
MSGLKHHLDLRFPFLLLFVALIAPGPLGAQATQGTPEDYHRALTLQERYAGLVVNVADNFQWTDGGDRVTFRRSVEGGHEFLVMDRSTGAEELVFDHGRMASALAALAGGDYGQLTLPFNSVELVAGGSAVEVAFSGDRFRCTLSNYQCTEVASTGGGGWQGGGGQGGNQVRTSPDGRHEALIHNHNVVVREAGNGAEVYRSHDGSEGNAYSLQSLSWAPDSRRLAAYRIIPGYERLVHYVESAPSDQLQPRHSTVTYTKPGDVLDVRQPVLFDVQEGRQTVISNALFPNAYSMSGLRWRDDGRELVFEYNQRGHDTYRVIGVNPSTGEARAIINEETDSFFYYRPTSGSGKYFRHDLDDGREIIWMSERDGWSHLYLYDGETGAVKNQITSGEWLVRDVEHVDEENRQIYFAAGGTNADQDPYFVHFYRINFDGTGLTRLTEANGTHTISLSPDLEYYVVTWSRVDLPHVTELRRTSDQQAVAELGRGDHSALLAAGWQEPEVFTALGRDGETEIWGIIVRPSNFDPSLSYPVIESIYAGPHNNHVPKAFSVHMNRGILAQAELGFVAVMIDGMGTSNRSKAFHDVAWKNLGDAGFPDRILWHEAVAEQYDYYDLSRVGIYGGSAGGQNAMGALLFHPDFYHAAVADNGCHDNRMDKIWWNELWMGEVGPHYSESSNVDNAHLLQGKLLLTVGELDTNVDPSSTYQVADALIRAGKDFDFLMIPGGGHGRGAYHERKRFDFFVDAFLDQAPPDWNRDGIAFVEEDLD